MFNLDKILERSLMNNVAMMKKYEFYVDVSNGLDTLLIFLTKKEMKKLTVKDSVGTEILNIPDNKLYNLFVKYYKKVSENKSMIVENLVGRTDIDENYEYEIYFDTDKEDTEYSEVLTFKELKQYAKNYKSIDSNENNIFEYADDFAQFFTKEEFEKINKGEIVLFNTSDRLLMVSSK